LQHGGPVRVKLGNIQVAMRINDIHASHCSALKCGKHSRCWYRPEKAARPAPPDYTLWGYNDWLMALHGRTRE
jgi:hypothetical protein